MSDLHILSAVLFVGMVAMTAVLLRFNRPEKPPLPHVCPPPDLAPITARLLTVEQAVRGLRPRDVRSVEIPPAKPHRHQWEFRSEEETNKQRRRIHICRVPDCRDTYVEETPQHGRNGGETDA